VIELAGGCPRNKAAAVEPHGCPEE
jgi:hypothetical protein